MYGNQNWQTTVYGTTPRYLYVKNYEIDLGRSFTFEDVKNIELNDLKILEEEEAFLKTQQAQNNSKREDLQAIKERLGMTERKRRENNADHLKKQIKAKPFEQSKVMNPSLKKVSQNRG